ncbi:SDR family NAD(P)-dependent oxidoreductase [Streptomyces sp. NPDC059467]|uniref:SDR family NAD(P)-dependent oxidoreductase n=1 Tax=Streptomyces sp. NPDC059467 TaxID=3346844 RepID=UPI003688B5AB
MAETLTVTTPGLTTVQDLGRTGRSRYGLPANGAPDQHSARVANVLCGNDERAPLLEITALDFACTPSTDILIAVTGAPADLTVAGVRRPQWEPVFVRAGDTVRIGSVRQGLRVYLAVLGSFEAEYLQGSCAPDTVLGFGTTLGTAPHAVDITDTEALTATLAGLEIDVLVNNAGVSRTGNILTADEFAVDEQIAVNIQAVLHLVRLLMPGMVERDLGHIVNISSIAGVYNFGGNTIYHATKAAVHTLSRQLRVDGYGRRVRVTEICPGRVETEIFGRLLGDMEAAQRQFYDGYESLKPEDIADSIEFAVDSPRHVNIGHIEILPTFQVPGGLNFERREG